MNTAYSLWRELAILAEQPGGYVLPIGALLIFFLAIWAVFNRLGSAFVITEKKPPVRIDEDFARRDREARQFAAWKTPTLTGHAKKGMDRERLDRVAHIGDRRSVR